MTKYQNYFLHDPIGNYESQLTIFDQNEIQKAMDQGLIVIGVKQDGTREIIKSVSDVVQPEFVVMKGVPMVLPSYVDTRIDELAKIVDNLVDSLSSQISAKTVTLIKNQLNVVHTKAKKTIEEESIMLSSNPIKK